MEGLFFAVDPIWWIAPLHLSSLITGLIGGAIVAIYLWYRSWARSSAPIRQPKPYQHHQINSADPSYAEKMLIEIRRYLTYHYPPAHSWAHISRDIGKYATDTRLIAIIEQLERAEYSKQGLTIDEKEQISRELGIKLKT